MGGDRVCVAGLDTKSADVIRLDRPSPTENLVQTLGIRPGAVVEVEWTPVTRLTRPHVEDGLWDPTSVQLIQHIGYQDFLRVLQAAAVESVEEAFGPVFRRGVSGSCSFEPGAGKRSLACLRPTNVDIYVPHSGKIRAQFETKTGRWSAVPLEDLAVRRHQVACRRCKTQLPQLLEQEFSSKASLLRVGLSREFKGACWLQVNGVYPVREPQHFV